MGNLWVAWLLLAGLIVYQVRYAFADFERDKKVAKVALHAGVLLAYGYLIVYLGMFTARMQYDLARGPVEVTVKPAAVATAAHPAPTAAKTKKEKKK